MGRSNKILRIVELKQMLKRWRNNASLSAKIPPGHVVILVGPRRRRFVEPVEYLKHPTFKQLLEHSEEEYGFELDGPLVIPCDESVFIKALRIVQAGKASEETARLEDLKTCRHVCECEPARCVILQEKVRHRSVEVLDESR